jgi:ABC-type glycerol-3-phosphate transport system substrate-binding protein
VFSVRHSLGRPILMSLVLAMLMLTGTALARTTVTLSGPLGTWPDALQQALAVFGAKHSVDVEIINMVSWGEAKDKVAAMAAGGVSPDVMYGDDATLNYYIMNGLSQPITSFAARDINLARYPGSILELLKYNGKDYILPTALSVYNTYCNLDMFDKSGLSHPTWDWSSHSFTWSDFVSMAKKLTIDRDGDGRPDQFGAQNFGWVAGLNQIGLWGLYLVNAEASEFYGDSAEVIAALEQTTALWTEYGVVGGSFTAGTAAMATPQSGFLNTLKPLTENGTMASWSVAAMPKGSHRAAESSIHGISISAYSKHPELAWKLAKFLAYDSEGAVLFTQAENRVPVLPETGRDFARRWASILSQDSMRALIDSPPYVWGNELRICRHPKGSKEIYPLLIQEAGRMVRAEISVRAAMTKMAPTIRALLRER